MISQYIGYLEKKNQNFPGVEILMTTTDSGLKTLRILKEFNISKLNLLVSNNSQEKYGENLKINILKNDLEKKASEKLISLVSFDWFFY